MTEEKVMFSFLALVIGEKMMSGEARDGLRLYQKPTLIGAVQQ